jgi:dTDP-4-dehydrorhamnose reductase
VPQALSLSGQPFTPDDTPAPQDAYGLSKHEAEQALWQVDASKAHTLLGWTPPVTMQAQLRTMAQAG